MVTKFDVGDTVYVKAVVIGIQCLPRRDFVVLPNTIADKNPIRYSLRVGSSDFPYITYEGDSNIMKIKEDADANTCSEVQA